MIDDELDVNFTIKAILEETGLFQVDTFNDTKSVLSIFRPGLYDLALLDIRMPEMNGFQLCRKLREIDNRLKMCFLTATEVLYSTIERQTKMLSMIWEQIVSFPNL